MHQYCSFTGIPIFIYFLVETTFEAFSVKKNGKRTEKKRTEKKTEKKTKKTGKKL